MQNLKPISVVHGIFDYSTIVIFEYFSQKYLNIRIRSTFVLWIYSYSYSVQNMIPNIFVFLFVLKRTFQIYSYWYSKKIFAMLCYTFKYDKTLGGGGGGHSRPPRPLLSFLIVPLNQLLVLSALYGKLPGMFGDHFPILILIQGSLV